MHAVEPVLGSVLGSDPFRTINFDLPFEGDILEQRNEELNRDPSLVYSDGWVVRVEPIDLEEKLKNLVFVK